MVALLKTTQIQEPSSTTVNMALGTGGNVTFVTSPVISGATSGSVTLAVPAVAGSSTITFPAVTGTVATSAGGTTAIGINGSSSGTTTINTSSVGSGTITIPAGTGTAAVQGVSTNIVSGTAQATTSGTSITFTGIPSWIKRITMTFQGVSTNGTSIPQIQIGSGSVTTTGYLGAASLAANGAAPAVTAFTTGFGLGADGNASYTRHGSVVLSLLSGNTWVASGTLADSGVLRIIWTAGSISLAGVLDRIVLTTVNGTDAFDAGSINILYE
jgi:hypothetical protein